MESKERMERELGKMQISILDIQKHSPIKDYNDLCKSFTKLVEAFDQLKNEP